MKHSMINAQRREDYFLKKSRFYDASLTDKGDVGLTSAITRVPGAELEYQTDGISCDEAYRWITRDSLSTA